MFHRDIQTWRRELKYDAQRSIFDEIRGVWIADETLSLVFDISSQSKQNLRSKCRSKIAKSMLIKIGYPNLLHDCDFLCFRESSFNMTRGWEGGDENIETRSLKF